jgi:polysaccharide deacetylase family protein (PEP-CTERM system associated)
VLSRHGVSATFFVLGWVAERHPALVRDICTRGHEVASHSYRHRLVYHLSPEQFREDARMAKEIIENITGTRVKGYRAPSYSIVKRSVWALDILAEEGYEYDSSIFPVHHDRYGMPDAERFPHVLRTGAGAITEIPPSTYRIGGQNIPVAGGGYFRLFPWSLTKMAIKNINDKDNNMAMVYLHPWEIDPDQPRIKGRRSAQLRHYINIRSTLPKLSACLNEFKFQPSYRFVQQHA